MTGQRPACRACRHDRKRMWRYGLNPEQYRQVTEGGCWICAGTKRLSIDHCHMTGVIRGLLCHKCNILAGWLTGPNVEAVMKYLNGDHMNITPERVPESLRG